MARRIVKRAMRSGSGIRTGGFSNPTRSLEMKFIDTIVTSITVHPLGGGAVIQLLNGIAPGSAANQRIGRKVTMKRLTFSIAIQYPATSAGVATFARFMIVYDRQTNAANPGMTDILDANTIEAQVNLSNRDRFKILKNWTFKVGPAVTTTNSAVPNVYIKRFTMRLPKDAQEVTFNSGTAGTVADIATGGLFLACITGGGIATAGASGNMSNRIRYTDV